MFNIFKKRRTLRPKRRYKNIGYLRKPNRTVTQLVLKRKMRTITNLIKRWTIIFILIIFFAITIGATLFYIINYIVYLKTGQGIIKLKTHSHTQHLNYVIGLNQIPAFPHSHFLFNDFIKGERDFKNPTFLTKIPNGYTKDEIRAIYTFLAKHKSIYIIDPKYSFNDARQFYIKQLPLLGFDYLFTVPETDPNKVPGVYFVNNKQRKGLHIYTVTGHDIWYELISITQAKTALSDRKIILKLKDLELKAQHGKELPAVSFWILKYPANWHLDMTLSPTLKIPVLFLSNPKRNTHLHIVPIQYTSKPVELLNFNEIAQVANKFIQNWGHDHEISLNTKKTSAKQLIIHDVKGIEYCFNSSYPDKYPHLCFLILPNPKNTIYYAFIFWGNQVEFYDYVKKNIQPKK